MAQAMLWLILLQASVENNERRFNSCVRKPAVANEVKSCAQQQRVLKGVQQAILNVPACELKQMKRTVCA